MDHDDPIRYALSIYGGGKKVKEPSGNEVESTYPIDLYVSAQNPTHDRYVVIFYFFNDITVLEVVSFKERIGSLGQKCGYSWFTSARQV